MKMGVWFIGARLDTSRDLWEWRGQKRVLCVSCAIEFERAGMQVLKREKLPAGKCEKCGFEYTEHI